MSLHVESLALAVYIKRHIKTFRLTGDSDLPGTLDDV